MEAVIAAWSRLPIGRGCARCAVSRSRTSSSARPAASWIRWPSICGRAGHLMALLCQPAEFQRPRPPARRTGGLGHRLGHPARRDRQRLRRACASARSWATGSWRIWPACEATPGDRDGQRRRRRPALARLPCQRRQRRVPGVRGAHPEHAARSGVPGALRRHDRSGDARRSRSALRRPDADGAPDLRARARERSGRRLRAVPRDARGSAS